MVYDTSNGICDNPFLNFLFINIAETKRGVSIHGVARRGVSIYGVW